MPSLPPSQPHSTDSAVARAVEPIVANPGEVEIAPELEEQSESLGAEPLALAGITALAALSVFAVTSRTSLLQPKPVYSYGLENSDTAIRARQAEDLSVASAGSREIEVLGETEAIAPSFSAEGTSAAEEELRPVSVSWPKLPRLVGEGQGFNQETTQAAMMPLPVSRTSPRPSSLALVTSRPSLERPAATKPEIAPTTAADATDAPASPIQQTVEPVSGEPALSLPVAVTARPAPLPSAPRAEDSLQELVATAPQLAPALPLPRPTEEEALSQPLGALPGSVSGPGSSTSSTSPMPKTPQPQSQVESRFEERSRLKFIVGARPDPRYTIPAIRRGSGCSTPVQMMPVVPAISPADLEQTTSSLIRKEETNLAQVESTMSEQLMVFLHVQQPQSTESVYQLQLTLQDDGLRQDLYNRVIDLPAQSGIVAIQVPKRDVQLQVGETYLWQAALLCDAEDPSHNPTATGWIKRVSPQPLPVASAEQAAFFAKQGIWPDAVGAMLSNARQNPTQAAQDWRDLVSDAALPNAWATESFILIR